MSDFVHWKFQVWLNCTDNFYSMRGQTFSHSCVQDTLTYHLSFQEISTSFRTDHRLYKMRRKKFAFPLLKGSRRKPPLFSLPLFIFWIIPNNIISSKIIWASSLVEIKEISILQYIFGTNIPIFYLQGSITSAFHPILSAISSFLVFHMIQIDSLRYSNLKEIYN